MQFWGIDLCKLGKEYLIALTYKYALHSRQNFWHITRLSIISRCKVIWPQKHSVFFGPLGI